jgi:phosphatidylglycerophosphate synthase
MDGRAEGSHPRMREMPKPRENPSVLGASFAWMFQWPYRFALWGLFRMGFLPSQLSLLSLLGNALCGALLLSGRRLVPGFILVTAGLFDIFDGGVARLRGEDSRKGALLDAVIDRLSDGLVFGAIFYAEFAIHGDPVNAGLALSALVVSLLVSHFRAEGEAAGVPISEGSVQRLERYVGLTIGLTVPGLLPWVLGALAALGLVTTFQRASRGWRTLKEPAR